MRISIAEFQTVWDELNQQLQQAQQRVVGELLAIVVDLEEASREQAARPLVDFVQPTDLDQLQKTWRLVSNVHLKRPYAHLRRKRLLPWAFDAFANYERDLNDIVRNLPRLLQLSGRELTSVVQRGPFWVRLSKSPRPLFLRASLARVVRAHLQRGQSTRTQIVEQIQVGLMTISGNWNRLLDRWCLEQEVHQPSPWDSARARKSLKKFEGYAGALAPRLAAATVSQWGQRLPKAESASPSEGDPVLEGWANLQSEWQKRLAIDLSIAEGGQLLCKSLQELRRQLQEETEVLCKELQALRDWVESCQEQRTLVDPTPARSAYVTPSSSRLQAFQGYLKLELRSYRKAWPDGFIEQVLEASRGGERRLLQILEAAEADHRGLLQATEQAREVMVYSFESGRDHKTEAIVDEATSNVLSLLEHATKQSPEWQRLFHPNAVAFVHNAFLELEHDYESSRLKKALFLYQRNLRRARERGEGLGDLAEQAVVWNWRQVNRLFSKFLVAIGWRHHPGFGLSTVDRRPTLPDEYRPAFRAGVPAIYRRLFKLEPLEERRFLIGRELELGCLQETVNAWQEGRATSVMVIGHRGSGKTSLLNCAFQSIAEDIPVLRGHFERRVYDEESLRQQLREILEVDEEDVLHWLSRQSRVIILEEVERTYLRRVGGYGGVRALQRLIAQSSRTTLWVLCMNKAAFQLLQAAVGLGDTFSHVIDTAAVTPALLREAVLSRHNLSGLRLRFPDPVRSSWRRPSKSETESQYFRNLWRRSDGVFRSAFEVWQGHIERTEAGVLFMRPLAEEAGEDVIEVLDLKNLFALVAIMQHGSLLPEEHLELFGGSLEASKAQLDDLIGRELIESDPIFPGFRIRPEAAPIVRASLYQKNLI